MGHVKSFYIENSVTGNWSCSCMKAPCICPLDTDVQKVILVMSVSRSILKLMFLFMKVMLVRKIICIIWFRTFWQTWYHQSDKLLAHFCCFYSCCWLCMSRPTSTSESTCKLCSFIVPYGEVALISLCSGFKICFTGGDTKHSLDTKFKYIYMFSY